MKYLQIALLFLFVGYRRAMAYAWILFPFYITFMIYPTLEQNPFYFLLMIAPVALYYGLLIMLFTYLQEAIEKSKTNDDPLSVSMTVSSTYDFLEPNNKI